LQDRAPQGKAVRDQQKKPQIQAETEVIPYLRTPFLTTDI
jgi:hypothetical protein